MKPSQKSEMELFTKIVNGCRLLAALVEMTVLDARLGS